MLLSTLLVNRADGADAVVIVVNSSNEEVITPELVRNIYADQVAHWGSGEVIHLYELSARSAIREAFYQETLGISARESAFRWNNRKITNTLKNLSPKTKRETAVLNAISRDKKAIGYVSAIAAENNSDLRIIMKIEQ